MYRRGIALVVILLFIGLTFAPSIHANIDKEMVEFTTEVCGLDGWKQTVKLTRGEAGEVDALFKSIRERFNKTESREEVEEIFKDAVVELDKYRLLGGLNIKQAQKMVTGGDDNQNSLNMINNPKIELEELNEYYNSQCYVVGNRSKRTIFLGSFLSRLAYFIGGLSSIFYLLFGIGNVLSLLLLLVAGLYEDSKTIAISQRVGFGIKRMIDMGVWKYYPAEGTIATWGSTGRKTWEGPFYGSIKLDGWLFDTVYIGMIGFYGLKIEDNYFGYAQKVKLQRGKP